MNEEIKKYVVSERQRGVADEEIKKALLTSGWKEEDVLVVLSAASQPSSATASDNTFKFGNLFRGRLDSTNYFGLSIIGILYSLITAYLSSGIVYLLLLVAFFIVSMGATIRRWHDLNRSGWMVLLTFIPLVNLVLWLFLVLKKGQMTANDYGPTPDGNKNFIKAILNM